MIKIVFMQVLQQMTSTFVEDRKSLMEHVTMLITQYHELLTQSLEDKEQYHLEEKNNAFVNIFELITLYSIIYFNDITIF